MLKTIFALAVMAAFAASAPAWADGTPCEGLAKLNLPHTEITSATLIAKGAFTAPSGGGGGGAAAAAKLYATLPAFCRVQITSRPTSDSDIKIEIWLPAEAWNGRLQALGNGGYESNISYSGLAQTIQTGYAGVANNTGHVQADIETFAIGHPEKLKDWGYRASHEATVAAKQIIAAHYGSGPKYSYYNGCSTGGRQGWVDAEYYPTDYDGLVVGDPSNPMTSQQAGHLWEHLATNKDEASMIPREKFTMIHNTVMDECDALDGLKDGLIADPRQCKFNIDSLLCKNGDAADCLTAPQLEALKKIVAGPKNPRTGEQITPGVPLGIPIQGIVDKNLDQSSWATFRFLFQDPNWDYHNIDWDKDIVRAEELGKNVTDATDPSRLKQLFDHGGKMLLYHGWNDSAVSPLVGIQLYDQAVAANGGLSKTYNDMRLFMLPGMNHCGGGEGPNTFDKMGTLADWVEKGKAPDQIIASHADATGKVDRTRPLCPYPQVAKYKGSGSIDEAQNFECAKP